MKTDKIYLNKQPIIRRDIEIVGWGLRFLVDSELDAYKAAYVHRNNPYGVKVEQGLNTGHWLVTVWNAEAKAMGCDC